MATYGCNVSFKKAATPEKCLKKAKKIFDQKFCELFPGRSRETSKNALKNFSGTPPGGPGRMENFGVKTPMVQGMFRKLEVLSNVYESFYEIYLLTLSNQKK